MAMVETKAAFGGRPATPAFVVSLGHGATHYILGTIFILLPAIKEGLGLSYTQAGGIISFMHVVSFLSNFGSGLVVDVTGRRVPFMVISMLLCGAGMFAIGLSDWYFLICAMAGIAAVGIQLWHPAAIAYIADEYQKARGVALSIHVLAANVGEAAAAQIAGLLLLYVASWHQAAMAASIPSFVMLAFIAVLLWPRERAAHAAAGDAKRGMSIGDYARGMGLLMRNMPAMFICLVSAMRTMAQSGLVVFVPLYMVNEIGTNAAVAGSALLLMQVAGGVATPVAGYMSDRIGPRPVMFACLSATSIVILGATFVSDATVYIGCIAVVGFVLFAVRPVLQAWIVEVVPDDFRGSATAVMFGVQALGNMTIPLVGGWIADNYGILNVFYVLAAIMLVANVVTFMLPKHKGRATRES